MVTLARFTLPPGTTVIESDLLDLTLPAPVDAVFSTATFHWVLDHDRLFAGWRPCCAPAVSSSRSTAGFVDVECWLQPFSLTPPEPLEYLVTVPLGSWAQKLPEERRHEFAAQVWDAVGRQTVDYVRLNISAPGRRLMLTSRLATRADLPLLTPIVDAAIGELKKGFLTPEQIASSRAIMAAGAGGPPSTAATTPPVGTRRCSTRPRSRRRYGPCTRTRPSRAAASGGWCCRCAPRPPRPRASGRWS
jgi:hypothetical protein